MVRFALIGFYILLFGTLLIPAHEPQDAFSLESFLDDQTIFVAKLKVLSVDADQLAERFFSAVNGHKPATAEEENELKRFKTFAKDWQSQFQQAGGTDIYLIYSLTDIRAPFLVIPVAAKHDVKSLTQLLANGKAGGSDSEMSFWLPRGQPAHSGLIHQALVFGSKITVEKLQTSTSARRSTFISLLNSAGDRQLQVAFALTDDARKVLEEVMPQLPKEFGSGPITHLTHGLQHLTASITLTPNPVAHFVVQSDDGKAAEAIKGLWDKFVSLLVLEAQQNHPEIVEPLKSLVPKVGSNRVTLSISAQQAEKLLNTIAPVIAKNARSKLFASNIRQMVIAMHNYHSDFGYLPSQAICDKNGNPLLSWRVAILPYIGEDFLWKEFKLNEPWDSPHNKKLSERMPKLYEHSAATNQPGMTYYKVFYSKKGMKPAAALLEQGKMTLGVITTQDGTSNTLLVTDVGQAVPWTKPEDILFDPQQPLPKLISPIKDSDRFWVGFCDGSVYPIRNDVKPEILRALITRNGGEAIDKSKAWDKP